MEAVWEQTSYLHCHPCQMPYVVCRWVRGLSPSRAQELPLMCIWGCHAVSTYPLMYVSGICLCSQSSCTLPHYGWLCTPVCGTLCCLTAALYCHWNRSEPLPPRSGDCYIAGTGWVEDSNGTAVAGDGPETNTHWGKGETPEHSCGETASKVIRVVFY